MAIGVTLPKRNGPLYLIHCARGWTARQSQTAPPQRRRSELLLESAGEASGMKPEPNGDPVRDDETESRAGGTDGTVGSLEEPARAGPGPKTKGA